MAHEELLSKIPVFETLVMTILRNFQNTRSTEN